MKYEMIFGDAGLFDGAGLFTGIDVVTRNIDDGLYRTSRLSECTPSSLRINPIVAMRRIIKEPKPWTAADQKAGRLPEVDCIVTTYDGKPYVFVGESCNNDQWSLRDCETGKVCHTPISWVLPIESPEEKAQREENEFVKSEMKNTTLSMEWSCVYERGLRAAYRKLKGGE